MHMIYRSVLAFVMLPATLFAAPADFPLTVNSQTPQAADLEVFQAEPRTFLVTFKDGTNVSNISAASNDLFMVWATNAQSSVFVTSEVALVNGGTGGQARFTFSAASLNVTGGIDGIYIVGANATYRQGRLKIRANPYTTGVPAPTFSTNQNLAGYTFINAPWIETATILEATSNTVYVSGNNLQITVRTNYTAGGGGGSGTLTGVVVGAGSSTRLTATNNGSAVATLNLDVTGLATGSPIYSVSGLATGTPLYAETDTAAIAQVGVASNALRLSIGIESTNRAAQDAVLATSQWAIAQYPNAVLRDGSRSITGNLNMAGGEITNVFLVGSGSYSMDYENIEVLNTTKVVSLNADLLDGRDGAVYEGLVNTASGALRTAVGLVSSNLVIASNAVTLLSGLETTNRIGADAALSNSIAALGGTYLVRGSNLSDVASTATARGNLGLGSAATNAFSTATFNANKIQGASVSTNAVGSSQILIYHPAAEYRPYALSGDVSMGITGAVTIGSAAITISKVDTASLSTVFATDVELIAQSNAVNTTITNHAGRIAIVETGKADLVSFIASNVVWESRVDTLETGKAALVSYVATSNTVAELNTNAVRRAGAETMQGSLTVRRGANVWTNLYVTSDSLGSELAPAATASTSLWIFAGSAYSNSGQFVVNDGLSGSVSPRTAVSVYGGGLYRLTYEVSQAATVTVTATIGGYTNAYAYAGSSGTATVSLDAAINNNDNVTIALGTSSGQVALDNVSIKRVTAGDASVAHTLRVGNGSYLGGTNYISTIAATNFAVSAAGSNRFDAASASMILGLAGTNYIRGMIDAALIATRNSSIYHDQLFEDQPFESRSWAVGGNDIRFLWTTNSADNDGAFVSAFGANNMHVVDGDFVSILGGGGLYVSNASLVGAIVPGHGTIKKPSLGAITQVIYIGPNAATITSDYAAVFAGQLQSGATSYWDHGVGTFNIGYDTIWQQHSILFTNGAATTQLLARLAGTNLTVSADGRLNAASVAGGSGTFTNLAVGSSNNPVRAWLNDSATITWSATATGGISAAASVTQTAQVDSVSATGAVSGALVFQGSGVTITQTNTTFNFYAASGGATGSPLYQVTGSGAAVATASGQSYNVYVPSSGSGDFLAQTSHWVTVPVGTVALAVASVAGYNDIILNARVVCTGYANASYDILCRINGQTSALYNLHRHYADGSAQAVQLNRATTAGYIGNGPSQVEPAIGMIQATFPEYTNTAMNKGWFGTFGGAYGTGTSALTGQFSASLSQAPSAITGLEFIVSGGAFATNTVIKIGVRK